MEETSPFYRRIRRIQMRVLRLAGLVPFENRTLNFLGTRLLSSYVNFAFTAVSSVYIFAFVDDCLHKRFNPDITSELFSFVGFHFRFMYMFSRRRKLGSMLKYAEELWQGVRSEEKVHVRLFVRKVSRLSVCYSGIILTTITLYVLSSQLPQLAAASSNETVHRVLPYPFFFDVQSSPNYEILLACQIVCLLTVTQTSVCVDTAIAFLIMIACGHFRLIKVRLGVIADDLAEKEGDADGNAAGSLPRQLQRRGDLTIEKRNGGDEKIVDNDEDDGARDPDRTDEGIRERVRECARYHREILDFCDDIAKLSSEIFMIELMSTTYNLSLIGILLAGNMPLAEKFKFAPVLLILTTQLFVCQYPPEILLQESSGVAETAYIVPPYRRDKLRIDRLLLILLTRAQIPYQLLAGGQIALSIESFGNMIRGAASFFTVLRNFN